VDRRLIIEDHMGAQEVVVGYKQGGKGDSAIGRVKPMGRSDVLFIGSVEALNDLFKRSERG
jgi:hypothetical protein